MTYSASRVIEIAETEIGYREKKSASDLDSKTANAGSGNYTKYGREMHRLHPSTMDYPAPWCDAFVDWCHYHAANKDEKTAEYGLCGEFNDYTVESARQYKDAGRWGSTPHAGDQIFFKNSGGICHTGIVVKASETRIVTIEGNKSNMVKRCEYIRSDSRIAGYGYPRWSGSSSAPSKPVASDSLAVDGKVGPATVRKWQEVMGTTRDGIIGGQSRASKANHSALKSIRYSVLKRGSELVRAVQRKLGCTVDGLLGPQTIKAIQRHLGVSADGHFGPATAKALQRRLNQNKF